MRYASDSHSRDTPALTEFGLFWLLDRKTFSQTNLFGRNSSRSKGRSVYGVRAYLMVKFLNIGGNIENFENPVVFSVLGGYHEKNRM